MPTSDLYLDFWKKILILINITTKSALAKEAKWGQKTRTSCKPKNSCSWKKANTIIFESKKSKSLTTKKTKRPPRCLLDFFSHLNRCPTMWKDQHQIYLLQCQTPLFWLMNMIDTVDVSKHPREERSKNWAMSEENNTSKAEKAETCDFQTTNFLQALNTRFKHITSSSRLSTLHQYILNPRFYFPSTPYHTVLKVQGFLHASKIQASAILHQ